MNLKALPRYCATAAATAALLAVAVLAGCGGPRLTVEPARAVDLQGTWRLDRTASDDAQAIVAAALPKPKRGGMRGGPRADGPAPDGGVRGDGGRGAPGDGGPRGDERGDAGLRAASMRDGDIPRWRDPGGMARSLALPAIVVRVGGGPRELVLVQDDRRRTFTPGDDTPYSVTDRFGTRQMRAGWDREEFVVESRDRAGLELVERFRRGASPDTLVATVTLKARGLDDIRVSSVYRRATDAANPAPPLDDGPPAPLR
jgi:hypothetical protein